MLTLLVFVRSVHSGYYAITAQNTHWLSCKQQSVYFHIQLSHFAATDTSIQFF